MNSQAHPLFLQALEALQRENSLGAEIYLAQLLRIQPKNSDALHLMGIVCGLVGKPLEAIPYLKQCLKLQPNNSSIHFNLAKALSDAQFEEESIPHHLRAIELEPSNPDAWVNYGKSLDNLRKPQEALACHEKAIALKPDMAEPWFNKGKVLSDLKQYEEALSSYSKAYQIRPNENFLLGILLHHKMLICDWEGLEEIYVAIQEGLLKGEKVAEPFGFQAISTSEDELQQCARIFSRFFYPPKLNTIKLISDFKNKKIRVAYLCGEFRAQATSVLMTGLYEMHDKEKFEIYALDNGWDDGSEMRARINQAFTEIIDIATMSDLKVAELISGLQIDILVNLNGFFGKARQGVFALKPAPIQINYLGFPGTLGSPYMDYLIADKIVVPENSQKFYDEKIIYLPNSYQANDQKRQISSRIYHRSELGLPDTGFVFCCFNNNYKITPQTFDSWMRILNQTRDSVLWLIEDNLAASRNLQMEAEKRGVAKERLIFAPRLPLIEHLARHRVADLFLDTLPYNAHTTASDALWAGTPVLTCLGNTFPGRVGASLLTALNLSELITHSSQQYENQAIKLATHPNYLLAIKNKLALNCNQESLFNSQLFAKNIESIYQNMYLGSLKK
jgi:predicted O-linked N-acetylglucosamine transferase (SPINDLY family)